MACEFRVLVVGSTVGFTQWQLNIHEDCMHRQLSYTDKVALLGVYACQFHTVVCGLQEVSPIVLPHWRNRLLLDDSK